MTEGKSVFCWHKYNINLDVKPSLFVISVFSQVLFCWYSFVDNSHLDPCLSSFFSSFSTIFYFTTGMSACICESSKNYEYCKPMCRKTHKYWFLCKHTLTEAAQSAGWVCFVLHFEAAFPLISSASRYPLHFLAVLIVYCNAREPAKSTAAGSSIFFVLFVWWKRKGTVASGSIFWLYLYIHLRESTYCLVE